MTRLTHESVPGGEDAEDEGNVERGCGGGDEDAVALEGGAVVVAAAEVGGAAGHEAGDVVEQVEIVHFGSLLDHF